MDVMGVSCDLRVMGGVVILEDALPLHVKVDIGIIVLSHLSGSVEPSADKQPRAVAENDQSLESLSNSTSSSSGKLYSS